MTERLDTAAWIAAYKMAYCDVLRALAIYEDIYDDTDKIQELSEEDLQFIQMHDTVAVLDDNDDCYPGLWHESLGEKRPQKLFCYGNTQLLKQPSIFICGSRNASAAARDFAMKCGKIIGMESETMTVVSGLARGVDSAAHFGALEAGGTTVALLPHGLRHLSTKRLGIIDDPVDFLALSEMPPSSRFTPQGALRRNKLMVGMAAAVIVVEPGDSGGTWYSAECARKMGRPLYYYEGERHDFVERMEMMGAIRIGMKNQAPLLADILRHCRRY